MNLPRDIQKDILSFVGHPIGDKLKEMPSFKKHLMLQTVRKVSSTPLICNVKVRFDYQHIYLHYEKQKLKNITDEDEIESQKKYIIYKTKRLKTIHDFEIEDDYEIEDIRHDLWKSHGMFVGKEWVRNNHRRLG